jgi:hypothetical protein
MSFPFFELVEFGTSKENDTPDYAELRDRKRQVFQAFPEITRSHPA